MNDRAFNKELERMIVECRHKMDENCQWKGELRLYQVGQFYLNVFIWKILFLSLLQEHLDSIHSNIKCPHCKEIFTSASAVAEHIKTNCSHFFMKCLLAPFCVKNLVKHFFHSVHSIEIIFIFRYEKMNTVDIFSVMNISRPSHFWPVEKLISVKWWSQMTKWILKSNRLSMH